MRIHVRKVVNNDYGLSAFSTLSYNCELCCTQLITYQRTRRQMMCADSDVTDTDRLRNASRALWCNHLHPGRVCLGTTTDIAGVAIF